MRLRPSVALRWLVPVILFAAPQLPAAAARNDESWHLGDGRVIKAHLAGVYGSTVLLAGKDFRALVPLEKINDQDLLRVADYLAADADRPAEWVSSTASVTKAVRKELEILSDKKLVPWTPSGPEPRLYLAYFSAGWCDRCRRFTPSLVKAYKEWQINHAGQVEVIQLSWDRDRLDHIDYVRKMSPPWKVLSFSANGQMSALEKWPCSDIPCLVALTPDGDVLFHTYRHGERYFGADYVLEATQQLVAQSLDTPAARIRRHRLAVVQHIRAKSDSPPVLYAARFDPKRYQTIEADEVRVSVTVDPRGQAKDAEVATPIPVALEGKLLRDLEAWLFLPAVSGGTAVERRVTLPLQIRPDKVAATGSSSTSNN